MVLIATFKQGIVTFVAIGITGLVAIQNHNVTACIGKFLGSGMLDHYKQADHLTKVTIK